MIVEIIAAGAVTLVGYIIYRHRKTVEAKVEADAKALKATAESELKKVQQKL